MNQDLLEEIYQKYYRDVYLYAYSLCKSHHLAQEITSDTFFKALISCDDEVQSIRYWLLRVCKNCFIDHWRRAQKHSAIPIEELPLQAKDDPLEGLLQQESHRSLYQAILQLPEQTREIVLLFYFHGFSGQQIAAMTGRSPGAVRTLLYRARAQLKDLLKGEIL